MRRRRGTPGSHRATTPTSTHADFRNQTNIVTMIQRNRTRTEVPGDARLACPHDAAAEPRHHFHPHDHPDDRQEPQRAAWFPEGYQPIARDDSGNPLAIDGQGKVWLFQHGAGDWGQKTLAFASESRLREYIAFQREFEIPDGEPLDALLDRRKRIEAFVKRVGAPHVKLTARQVLAELREEIEDRRFWKSGRGASIAERQRLGQRCEEALCAGGAPGRWMVRAHHEEPGALVVIGRFAAPWTEAKVRGLLEPILGTKYRLQCREAPPSW